MGSNSFSYRLKVSIEPNWGEIIKQIIGLMNEGEQREFAARLTELPEHRMLHRHYDFTEFFDSQTGLTLRFQRIHFEGRTFGGFVDEFADAGYLFGRDSPLIPEGQARKHQIAITEHGISTECFDPHTGQLSTAWGPSLFAFPIDAVVEFGVALHLRFPQMKISNVIEWPSIINAALQKGGTTYHDMWNYTPRQFALEKEDRDFFVKYGHPKLATTTSWPGPYFEHPCCYYSIELDVFTAETAVSDSRLAFSHFEGERLI